MRHKNEEYCFLPVQYIRVVINLKYLANNNISFMLNSPSSVFELEEVMKCWFYRVFASFLWDFSPQHLEIRFLTRTRATPFFEGILECVSGKILEMWSHIAHMSKDTNVLGIKFVGRISGDKGPNAMMSYQIHQKD